MATKPQIKEEDPLSDDVAPHNDREIFTRDVTMKSDRDAVLLDKDCDVALKTEIKETSFPGFCSQKERELDVQKQISSETLTCSSNCVIYIKTEVQEQTMVSDFDSQNSREFLPEDPATKVKKYNSDDEMDSKIGVKVEPSWVETEISSGCDEIKDGDLPPVKCSRLRMETFSGDSRAKSPLPSAEVPGRVTIFCNEKDYPENNIQESDVTEIPTVEEYIPSGLSDAEVYESLNSKHKNLNHDGKISLKCSICGKSFKYKSYLKHHEVTHSGERPYICKICNKSFTQLSSLKIHNLIHEGSKPHRCKICDKCFTHSSSLKVHTVIHEGKKPYKCRVCDKRFTHLSHLKVHNLIHEGKKPHQCRICDKSFTQLSGLKRHNMIHENKKPHQCKTCDKSFSQFSNLKTHSLIHDGKKPHQCKNCNKSFTQLSHLKKHNLIH